MGEPLEAWRLTLPLPPGVNNQYATVKGRRTLSAEARTFKKAVRKLLEAKLRADPEFAAFARRLAQYYIGLFLDFYFETPYRRDLDGGLKIAQDVLCETLGVNDNRVVDVHLVKHIDPLRPRLELEVECIRAWQFDEEYLVLKP